MDEDREDETGVDVESDNRAIMASVIAGMTLAGHDGIDIKLDATPEGGDPRLEEEKEPSN